MNLKQLTCTKQYLHETPAQKDPIEGNWLLPANSTFTQIPQLTQEGYVYVWNDTSWVKTQDHRGQTIWKDWQTSTQITQLGPIPQGWSLERPEKPVTKDDLLQFIYNKKCQIAYTGVIIKKSSDQYIFQTDQNSITMSNSQAIAFSTLPQSATVNWKVYQDGFPVLVTLTKAQFLQIFTFGMQMINNAFAIQGTYNKQVAEITEEQLQDKEFIAVFKTTVQTKFNQIQKSLEIEDLVIVSQ